MSKPVYHFVFPFVGQVKTQLKIVTVRSANGKEGRTLAKPKAVKQFEKAVRLQLLDDFPLEKRPISGHLSFQLVHYTQYKRDEKNVIIPKKEMDLDNVLKTMQDCFQPQYRRALKTNESGEVVYTKKGNARYTKELAVQGVIEDDKYIVRAGLFWVPVETEKEERIEVFVTTIDEKTLFTPPNLT